MMTVDVVTLFPEMFSGLTAGGVLSRALRQGTFAVRVHDLRRWGVGRHHTVDDAPYGGGGGMVLRPEPFWGAVEWIRHAYPAPSDRVVLLSPQGGRLDHAAAERLAGYGRLILLCGRYEGVDDRVRAGLADEELSVGDVVLTGGELPALATIEAVARFIPGVLGGDSPAGRDSFAEGLLESPYYTRPVEFRGRRVPEVLLSGDHGAIERWRAEEAQRATSSKRPDLLDRAARGRDAIRQGEEGGDERDRQSRC